VFGGRFLIESKVFLFNSTVPPADLIISSIKAGVINLIPEVTKKVRDLNNCLRFVLARTLGTLQTISLLSS